MSYPGATAGLNQALEKTMEYLRVQLKVCEGCGNLWFRTQSAEEVYGRCCASKLAQHAKARQEQKRSKRHAMALRHAVMMGGAN
jgi:predicted metal-binding protein